MELRFRRLPRHGLGGRPRRRPKQPGRRVCGDRGEGHPWKHLSRRWPLSLGRRWEDVASHRAPRMPDHQPHRRPSARSRYGLGRGARSRVREARYRHRSGRRRPQSGHLQDDRRRKDLGASALQEPDGRRHRRRDRSLQSANPLCSPMGSLENAVHAQLRRPRQRPSQIHGRR